MTKKISPKNDASPPAAQLRQSGQRLRTDAEAKLKARKEKATPSVVTKAEAQRLIHELEVHQVELEMQNEELIQSRAELESTLNLYAELYAFAPVGYFTLTRDGTIRRANLTAAKLMGVGSNELIRRRFAVFISPPSRVAFSAFLKKVFTSENKQTCEVVLQNDESAPLWVNIEAIVDSGHGKGELCYAIVSDIRERKKKEAELTHFSTHDMLTGLYNYGFFLEEMTRLEREREFPVSIMMADVNHLKVTNDHEGHAAGDALLKRAAQALTVAFRAEDVVARIGGDEFAVLLPATNAVTAEVLFERMRQVVQEHNRAHPETPIDLSLGMSTAETSESLSQVLNQADLNMYREKSGGGGRS